jgi:predicted acyl esterase
VRAPFPILVLAILVLGGCLGSANTDEERPATSIPVGVHPYPGGDEWPVGLVGPFDLLEVIHLPIPSFDGTVLDGWIIRPDVPEDTRVPIVLWSAPYFGQCSWLPPTTVQAATTDYPSCHYDIGTSPELWDNDQVSESVPVNVLVEHGYAVAVYNVRGTGNSGGCFEWFGPNEQRDQPVLVETLAALPWSNGRVGMMGLSYHGTTPWEAAIQNPPSLKTIVVAGMVGDAYTFSHTPQGATFTIIPVFDAHFSWRVSLSPPLNGPPEHYTLRHLPVLADRACPEVLRAFAEDTMGTATDLRDGSFWAPRRLIDQFPDVTASVFLTHGFQDHWGSGHQQQENAVWNVLTKAPKRQLEGQWGHEFPNFNSLHPEWALADWNDRLLEWLDYWLKGIGDAPPRVGIVDYQDNTGVWHESTSWPPAEAHEEVLYLTEWTLSPTPRSGTSGFRSVPTVVFPNEAVCPSPGTDALGVPGLLYTTPPLESDVFLAGNPMAFLKIASDQPGGLVAVHLYDAGSDSCEVLDLRRLGAGVADLRFHRGNYRGENFPIGESVGVRIDITNFAELIPAGHRLGVLLSRGDSLDRTAQPFAPSIRVDQSSHVIVPIVSGTFGGDAPTLDYPPRPFVPRVGEKP